MSTFHLIYDGLCFVTVGLLVSYWLLTKYVPIRFFNYRYRTVQDKKFSDFAYVVYRYGRLRRKSLVCADCLEGFRPAQTLPITLCYTCKCLIHQHCAVSATEEHNGVPKRAIYLCHDCYLDNWET